MATSKRARPEEGFYRSLERSVSIKAEKILHPKQQGKVDTEKMYPIEVSREIEFVFLSSEPINST